MRNLQCASLVFLLLIPGLSVKDAPAQDPPHLALQGSVGAREDITQSVCGNGSQNSFGGSIHYYLTKKTTIGTEFLGFNHCNQVFTYYAPQISGALQMTHHFNEGRVRPYVIGGLGFIYHASGNTSFDASGGGGAKFFISKSIYVAPEAQFGSYTTIRGAIHVGFMLR